MPLISSAKKRAATLSKRKFGQLIPMADGGTRLHLRSNEVWHFAVDEDAVLSVELGDVFLTECGWWIERSRVTSLAVPSMGGSGGRLCEPCISEARARAMGERRF